MIPQAIGFFGWKRPQVAAKTLRALARCPGIERWPLIAFLDAGSDPATTKAIEQWTASPLLGIRQSPDRLGCSGNLTRGILDLFDLCSDRFIALEDDVYPAEGFIDGLRVGLNRFQSAHTIKTATLDDTGAVHVTYSGRWKLEGGSVIEQEYKSVLPDGRTITVPFPEGEYRSVRFTVAPCSK